jgi:predicted transcriptional regulator
MIPTMRTTLTIADDVLRELKRLARSSDRPMTEIANEVLRAGLVAMREPARKARPFKESPVDMGEPQVDLTKALALAGAVEDEEQIRKLQLRK